MFDGAVFLAHLVLIWHLFLGGQFGYARLFLYDFISGGRVCGVGIFFVLVVCFFCWWRLLAFACRRVVVVPYGRYCFCLGELFLVCKLLIL